MVGIIINEKRQCKFTYRCSNCKSEIKKTDDYDKWHYVIFAECGCLKKEVSHLIFTIEPTNLVGETTSELENLHFNVKKVEIKEAANEKDN